MRNKNQKLMSVFLLASSLMLMGGCVNEKQDEQKGLNSTTKTEDTSKTSDDLKVTKEDIKKGIYVKFASDEKIMKSTGMTKKEVQEFKKSVQESMKKQYKEAEKENKKNAAYELTLVNTLNPYILTDKINSYNKREVIRKVKKDDDWSKFGEQFVIYLMKLHDTTGLKDLPKMASDFNEQLKSSSLSKNSYMKSYEKVVNRLKTIKTEKEYLSTLKQLEAYVNTPEEVEYYGYLMPGNFYADYTMMKYQELSYANYGYTVTSLLDEDDFYYTLQGLSKDEKKFFIKSGRELVKEEKNRKYETNSFERMNMERLNLILDVYDLIEQHDYSVADKYKKDYSVKLKALKKAHKKIETAIEQLNKKAS